MAGRWAEDDERHRRDDITRRRVLQGMLATAGMAAVGTGLGSWVTQGPARAAGLVLPPGSRPYPSRPEGADMLPAIEHVIIYMQENQSYDHYYGTLGRGDGFTLDGGGVPTNSNVDASNNVVKVFHEPTTCDTISGDHSWNGTHLSINGGAMDGFAKVSGDNVMGYYDQTNLPFYHGLANTFPICDRWFASVPGPTYPNRRYLQAATSVGVVATDTNELLATPTAPHGTIWDRLNAHGITWKDYAIDLWDLLMFPTKDPAAFLNKTAANRAYFKDFLHDCYHGTLPQVSIISPGTQDQYDEGSRDVQNGEAYSFSIINAVLFSPLWPKCAIFFPYDEHGGGYDHVPPPAAVAPDSIKPRIQAGVDQPGGFDQYGVRVPGFVISPYAKKDYVSHVVHDHTSILKFIETKFNLGALTYRDANADNLFDCFDFSTPAFIDPPLLPEPGLPAKGSACQPQPRPAVNPRVTPPPTTTPPSTAPTTATTSPPTTGSPAVTQAAGATPVSGSPNFTG